RSEVVRLIAVEAAFLGIGGALLGIPLGIGLARLMCGALVELVNHDFGAVDVPRTVVAAAPVAWGMLVGVVTALVAAVSPAREAMRLPVQSILRRTPVAPRSRPSARGAIASIAFLTIGLALWQAQHRR